MADTGKQEGRRTVIKSARILYRTCIPTRRGERHPGYGWAYRPLIERNVVAMLNREAVAWPDVPPLYTGERVCKHAELGAYYLVRCSER